MEVALQWPCEDGGGEKIRVDHEEIETDTHENTYLRLEESLDRMQPQLFPRPRKEGG